MSPSPSLRHNGHLGHIDPDETTPLLAVDNAGPATQSNIDIAIAKGVASNSSPVPAQDASHPSYQDEDRPLDKLQVFILCYTGCMSPICFFCIFPFIAQMVRDTGVPEAEVGFYTGLVESLFSITQMLVMILWSRAADRYGRKPVTVISAVGIAAGMTSFGFNRTVAGMIVGRCVAGAFSGQQVVIRTMFSEISTPRTAARAFSLFAFSGNLGIFLGPFIGGLLSTPAEQYPGVFGDVELFVRFPYALATITVGVLTLSSAVLCAVALKETLPSDMERKDSAAKTKPLSTRELITTPGVSPVLFMYGWSALIGLGFTAIIPPFWFARPALGGYGFSTLWTSVFLALAGATQALWTLLVFPPWQRRGGVGSVLRTCWYLFPFLIYVHPTTSILRRQGFETAFWVSAVVATIVSSANSMTYTGCQLALNDVSPSHQSLGELNAIALTMTSGIRAAAPAGFSSLFALGVKYSLLGGYFIWVLLSVMGLGFWIALRYVPEKALAPPKLKTVAEPEPAAADTDGRARLSNGAT